MKRKTCSKVLWALAFFSVLVSPVIAGGQQDGGVPTLRFSHGWDGSDQKSEAFQPLLQEYIESHRDTVVIEPEFVLSTDRIQKVQVDIASGSPPDVMLYWAYEANIGDMVRNGVLLDMEEFFEESAVSREQFAGWPAVEIDGGVYGIPLESFSGFFLANERIFDELGLEVPSTMEELSAVAPVLRDAGYIPLAMSSQNGDPGHLFFSALTYQFEDGLTDTQAMFQARNFDYPANRRAAETVEELIGMAAIPNDTISTGGWAAQTALFTSGRAAMIHSFPWMIPDFLNDGTIEDYVVTDIPRLPGATRDPADFTVGGISQIVVVSQKAWDNPTKRPHVIEFVEWLVSDGVLATLAEETGMPVAKNVAFDTSGLSSLERQILDHQRAQDLLPLHEAYFADSEDFDFYKRSVDELFAGMGAAEFVERVDGQLAR
jgi:raffinose/stachyose/melibiose transport system substrate-binding protein